MFGTREGIKGPQDQLRLECAFSFEIRRENKVQKREGSNNERLKGARTTPQKAQKGFNYVVRNKVWYVVHCLFVIDNLTWIVNEKPKNITFAE